MKTAHQPFGDTAFFHFASTFFRALQSPAEGWARARDWSQVVSMGFPDVDQATDRFRDEYWAAESFSKTPFEIPGINRVETAFQKFWDAEEVCKQANARLCEFESRPGLPIGRLRKARSLVAAVLGKFSWDDCLPHMSFGPGASTSVPRRRSSHANKWEFATHITAQCLPLYLAFRQHNNGWWAGDRSLTVVGGNKVTTVPKNAKTDRVIAVEPDWNMFFQRGVGGAIRHRLRTRLGLLTPDAQVRNRKAAQLGSLDGSLATIDLSSASDTVSLALCEALLPHDWFSAMLQCRSPEGTVGEKTVTYEKISSMGNGFTFELETLLFWALAKSCCKVGSVLVYGDDIIIPVDQYEEVTSLLRTCGFSVNEKKSFCSGPFRESCGGHYHRGQDVTPPYFKVDFKDEANRIKAGNRLMSCASQSFNGWFCDVRFEPCHDIVRQLVARRYWGTNTHGDSMLWVPFDLARPNLKWCRKRQAWRGSGYVKATGATGVPDVGGMFASLYGVATEETHVVTHGRYKAARLYTYRWEDPPLWL